MDNKLKILLVFCCATALAIGVILFYRSHFGDKNEHKNVLQQSNMVQEEIVEPENVEQNLEEEKNLPKDDDTGIKKVIKKFTKNKDIKSKKTVSSNEKKDIEDKQEEIVQTQENITAQEIGIEKNVKNNEIEPKNESKFKNLFVYDLGDISKDKKIVNALEMLQNAGEEEVLNNIKKDSVRIKFDDLAIVQINPSQYFAVTTYHMQKGKQILINSRYKNNPTEQIACLIAHEAMHIKNKSDLAEEVRATQKEMNCWKKFKSDDVEYPQDRLTLRLNNLLKEKELDKKISNTEVYQDLK